MNHFTRAARSGYHAAVAETTATGIDVPSGAAMSRKQYAMRLFCRLGVSSNGRPGGRSRKAHRCSTGTSTPVSVAHPIDVGMAVTYRNWSNTMSNTTQGASARNLLLHHSTVELLVAPEAAPETMLEQASLYLAQCRDVIYMIGGQHEATGDALWGAVTLLELAKGLVDNVSGDVREGGAQ